LQTRRQLASHGLKGFVVSHATYQKKVAADLTHIARSVRVDIVGVLIDSLVIADRTSELPNRLGC
jgi:hypothetical protein